jgi:hypothetical protein
MKKWILLLIACFWIGACGEGDIGDSCDTSGATDECVDGAICTNTTDGAVCRKVCTSQDDCSDTETCNGISGTNTKSCQPN